MPTARRPRQARAIATRRRVYEAAVAEFERSGVEAARIEDIVAAAGVSWGTFFTYFPSKDDVVLEAAIVACAAFADACRKGLAAGSGTGVIVGNAFTALRRAAPAPGPLRDAIMRGIANQPERLSDHLGEDVPNPVLALAEVLEAGQRRGDVAAGEPPESLAAVLVHATIAAGRREAAMERAAGATERSGLPLTVLTIKLLLRGMRPDPAPEAAEAGDVRERALDRAAAALRGAAADAPSRTD
ncbi:TetR/AcrR family transcriptional regulator [Actinomadura violacea]|uniref:TetR/AcrR family transcriptional regulator n=1 Tax=Actinomadura violacea TaxID=2819934 RepID=A0ABS3RPK4_9ACTN|nr:TetR/AcrR family transcriptional regulator [Actinomadura violacea]MBO2458675.1 TetR/AcrR family transcriptional regulator [Actinomadura violacea]